MNNLEIVGTGEDCEVWDYWGNRMFEGTYAECQLYIADTYVDETDE